jgi:DNA-directed RNA polymerase specialized sigma24 family protein
MPFPETRWSVLALATVNGDERARQALDELCRRYWQPVCAVIRTWNPSCDDPGDHTQAFFAYLLERSALRKADRSRGRFRTFLLTLLWRFLRDERKRALAGKRGGEEVRVSLDDDAMEELPGDAVPLAETLDREWALATLDRALEILRAEVVESRGEAGWAALKCHLPGSAGVPPMTVTAEALGIGEGGTRAEIHRLRSRCREVLRRELMKTVSAPDELDDEIRHLCRSLRGTGERMVGAH